MTRMGLATRNAWGAVLCALVIGCWVFLYDDASSTGTAVLGGYRERWFLLCSLVTYGCLLYWLIALSRPGKAALGRMLLLHLGIALSLAILEVPAFLGNIDYRDVFGRQVGHRAAGGKLADPRLSRTGRPNVRFQGTSLPDLAGLLGAEASPIPVDFQTDAYGLRNKSTKTDPGIFFLGDSVLVAGLVPIDSIVSERVEKLLGIAVLNVSEVGYSPQEELIRLEALGLPLQDKLVVHFIFEGNDLSDSMRWRARSNRSASSAWPESGFMKSLLRTLHRPKRTAGRERSGHFVTAAEDDQEVYFLYDSRRIDACIDEFSFIARAMQGAARKILDEGGSYAVVFIPTKIRVLHGFCTWPEGSGLSDPQLAQSSMFSRLAQACEEAGIPLLDLTPSLVAASGEGRLAFFAADTHLNAVGHEVMANALGPWITALQR